MHIIQAPIIDQVTAAELQGRPDASHPPAQLLGPVPSALEGASPIFFSVIDILPHEPAFAEGCPLCWVLLASTGTAPADANNMMALPPIPAPRSTLLSPTQHTPMYNSALTYRPVPAEHWLRFSQTSPPAWGAVHPLSQRVSPLAPPLMMPLAPPMPNEAFRFSGPRVMTGLPAAQAHHSFMDGRPSALLFAY
eukprot:GGOE01046851.1.p2 GENE.GGOE01046851.1~~GGOE01046851.1.p2  ORF type:complete len:193 (-),score=21.79 GGOE01046851.1:649-1227(-)